MLVRIETRAGPVWIAWQDVVCIRVRADPEDEPDSGTDFYIMLRHREEEVMFFMETAKKAEEAAELISRAKHTSFD